MQKIFTKLKQRFRLPIWADLLIILFATAAIWWGMVSLSHPIYLERSLETPLLILLNTLPIILIIVTLYLASGRSIISSLVTAGFFLTLGEIHRVKVLERSEPFMPTDIRLIREALAVVEQYNAQSTLAILGTVVAIVLLLALLIRFFTAAKLRPAVRVVGPIISLALLLTLTFTVYANEDLYDSFDGVFGSRLGDYDHRGFVYSFMHDITALSIGRPPNPNTAEFHAREGDVPEIPAEIPNRPNVVMLMSEAFNELTESPYLDFTNHRDPLENFRQIREESFISGDLIVDVIGGGTIFTEFAALTGVSPTMFSRSIPPYEFVRDNTDSIARQFSNLGYDTIALHPFHGWFYNRYNVFERFGFDAFLYGDAEYHFEGASRRGGWVSEEATMDALIDLIDERTHLDDPLFLFCITVQNHGGYLGKYSEERLYLFDTDLDFDEEELLILDNFIYGLFDIDRELARLVARLESDPEPYVLVYFGDHAPSLRRSIYQTLGWGDVWESPIYALQAFTVPFFIWQNEAAREEMDLEARTIALGLQNEIEVSAFYLGAMLMQVLDFDQWSPFLTHVNALREILPIARPFVYKAIDGEMQSTLPEHLGEAFEFYWAWSYYKIFVQTFE